MKLKNRLAALLALLRLSDNALPFMLTVLLVPLVALALFGLFAIVRHNYLLPFLGLLAFCTFAVLVPQWLLRRKTQKARAARPERQQFDFQLPEAPDYWTPFDRQVRQDAMPELLELLDRRPDWADFPQHGLTLAQRIAERYNKGTRHAEWSFSPIELLTISEHLSQRYRAVLKGHVPGIEHIKIRHLLWADRQVDRLKPLFRVYEMYRKVRMISPEGIIAELRSQLMDRVFGDLSDDMQYKLKYLLLLEALHTAIDLYGGHFRFDDEELGNSATAQEDEKRRLPPPEPLRICLLGQVSAGKSSIINLLDRNTPAEVSALPSTAGVEVHPFNLDGGTVLNLVDLPGLNGSADNEKILLREITRCDLVLWVLKASQPARKLDQQFSTRLREWFAQDRNTGRQPPVIIGLLNQVDRLGAPNDWNPPYDLSDDSPKARLIREALAYNQELLQLPTMLPLSIAPDKPHYNVPELLELIQEHCNKALNVQLNRRRREKEEFSLARLPGEWQRVTNATTSLFKVATRKSGK